MNTYECNYILDLEINKTHVRGEGIDRKYLPNFFKLGEFDQDLINDIMKVGKVYMVNNGITHWAYNQGTTDRMHLVISVNGQQDYLENKCKIYPK